MEVGKSANPSAAFGMAGNRPQIPHDTILERFRALKIRDGEEEVGHSSSHSAEEIVSAYGVVLSELTFVSRPMIMDLTVIAGEHQEFAEEIVNAILDRITKVPDDDQKLALFYLVDRIVKAHWQSYLKPFAARLPEVFVEAYHQVPPGTRQVMKRIFGAWCQVFSTEVLFKMAVGIAPDHPFLSGAWNPRLFRPD